MKIDYNRNNRIKLRNFSISQDFHDLVKTLLVRMIRRKHKKQEKVQIYTEYNITANNENYPDIQVILKEKKKDSIVIYEIQDTITKKWMDQIQSKHEESTLIIVPLKKIYKRWESRVLNELNLYKKCDIINILRIVLEDYAI